MHSSFDDHLWNHLLDFSIRTISWHFLSSWVPLIGYHLWVDLVIICRFLIKYLSLDTIWNKQTRYPFALLSCTCYHYHELLWLTWTKMICLSFQVRFEPMTSFFTPLAMVILPMLYLSLVSNPNWFKYLGSLAHEQIHVLTTRSSNHSRNSGKLMNLKHFICYAWSYEVCTICTNRILVRDEMIMHITMIPLLCWSRE